MGTLESRNGVKKTIGSQSPRAFIDSIKRFKKGLILWFGHAKTNIEQLLGGKRVDLKFPLPEPVIAS